MRRGTEYFSLFDGKFSLWFSLSFANEIIKKKFLPGYPYGDELSVIYIL